MTEDKRLEEIRKQVQGRNRVVSSQRSRFLLSVIDRLKEEHEKDVGGYDRTIDRFIHGRNKREAKIKELEADRAGDTEIINDLESSVNSKLDEIVELERVHRDIVGHLEGHLRGLEAEVKSQKYLLDSRKDQISETRLIVEDVENQRDVLINSFAELTEDEITKEDVLNVLKQHDSLDSDIAKIATLEAENKELKDEKGFAERLARDSKAKLKEAVEGLEYYSKLSYRMDISQDGGGMAIDILQSIRDKGVK